MFPSKGPLAFWHETPEMNTRAFAEVLGEYYMTFRGKSEYRGPFDGAGVPLLDYRGDIGLQHNPIAIAQYGLACYNRFRQDGGEHWRSGFLRVADWLAKSLEENRFGLGVWHHHFDWPYRQRLIAPWYSGLAQGNGLSVLVRAAAETGRSSYADAARAGFASFTVSIQDGGVVVRDADGHLWIEEYLVEPPSHILNGFIWALWGVHDYAMWANDVMAWRIFEECVETIAANLEKYDSGFWSLYELPAGAPPMLASAYYHRLHVVQLRVLHRLTGQSEFSRFSDRWQDYLASPTNKARAYIQKAAFKLRHY